MIPSLEFGDLPAVAADDDSSQLPFAVEEVVRNLREERYQAPADGMAGRSPGSEFVRSAYYAARPLLPVMVRRHLQKFRLRGWQDIPFPSWPVDFSVDRLLERALIAEMRARNVSELPFVWFWPDGARSAVMMTHDVEGSVAVNLPTS